MKRFFYCCKRNASRLSWDADRVKSQIPGYYFWEVNMMRRLRWNPGLLMLPLLLVGAPAVEARTTVSDFRVKGNTATALFESVDPNNSCLVTFVSVVSADTIEKILQSGRTQFVRTTVVIAQQDTCTQEVLFFGEGSTDVHVFQVASNLSTAKLTATVPIVDLLSGTFSDFQFSLTWTATSKATTTNSTESFKDKELGIKIRTKSHSTMVEAVATGTVIGLGQNFTPESSDEATIQRQNNGSHSVQKTF
jgi:hypothetical protein